MVLLMLHSSTSLLQVGPWNPGRHLQVNPAFIDTHLPEFWQGWEAQRSLSSQFTPKRTRKILVLRRFRNKRTTICSPLGILFRIFFPHPPQLSASSTTRWTDHPHGAIQGISGGWKEAEACGASCGQLSAPLVVKYLPQRTPEAVPESELKPY